MHQNIIVYRLTMSDELCDMAIRDLGLDPTVHGFMDVCHKIYGNYMRNCGFDERKTLNADEVYNLACVNPVAAQACFFLGNYMGRVTFDYVHKERNNTVWTAPNGTKITLQQLNGYLGMKVSLRNRRRLFGF